MILEKYLTEAKSDSIIEKIAKQELDIPTLKTRNSDELDFYDLSVWQIKKALQIAFDAGRKQK